jgi:uncharacterized protein YndB with AHSA1/START domain
MTKPVATLVRMTTTVQVKRSIAAPADIVFALVSDVTRMGEWSPEATGGVWKKASGPAVGARFTGRNRRGKRTWSTTCRITDYDPPNRFAFQVTSGPLSVAWWRYDILPTETGCDVTETWTDTRGATVKFLGRIVSGVGDREAHNRAGMETTLAGLAAVAESATA